MCVYVRVCAKIRVSVHSYLHAVCTTSSVRTTIQGPTRVRADLQPCVSNTEQPTSRPRLPSPAPQSADGAEVPLQPAALPHVRVPPQAGPGVPQRDQRPLRGSLPRRRRRTNPSTSPHRVPGRELHQQVSHGLPDDAVRVEPGISRETHRLPS